MKQFRAGTVRVPTKGHPVVQMIYREMLHQRIGYDDLAKRAGIQPRTIRSWRTNNNPYLTSAEAVLGALGFQIVVRRKREPKAPKDPAR